MLSPSDIFFPLHSICIHSHLLRSAQLFETIDLCSLNLVRCILPNNDKKSGVVDYTSLTKQVVHQDVLSSIRMRQEGFSFKAHFNQFYERYITVIPPKSNSQLVLIPSKTADIKALSKLLVKALLKLTPQNVIFREDNIQFGTKSVFIRHKTINSFEALRKLKLQDMDRAVVSIQATWRMGHQKNNHAKLKKGVSRTQATWRAVYYRQVFKKKQLAASILQKHGIGFVQRKRFNDTLKANTTIANFHLKLKVSAEMK